LLARAPQNKMSRAAIAAMLWDSTDDQKSHANLRQLLARMRKAFASFSDYLELDEKIVALKSTKTKIDFWMIWGNATLSIDDFLQLFRGELLAGIADESETFSQWLIRERTALTEKFFSATTSALIEMTRFGSANLNRIEPIAKRMIEIEPEREITYRTLIEIYGRVGNRALVEKTRADLAIMLQREFASGPSPETQAVVRRVSSYFHDQSPNAQILDESPQKQLPRIALSLPRWITENEDGASIVQALIEDVANELTRYRSFVVLAPHSSFLSKSTLHETASPIDLKVDYEVSGFVKHDNGRNLLSLRSIRCQTREIIWAGEFPVAEADLLRSYRSLSLKIAKGLASSMDNQFDRRGCQSSSAYAHYLFGREHQRTLTLPSVRRARKKYLESIDDDPHFGSVRARVAETLFDEWSLLGGNAPELLAAAKTNTAEAMAREPDAAIGYWIDGLVSLYQREYDTSLARFDVAEALSPNSADLLVEHANALAHVDRTDEAIEKFERALTINPLPPDLYWRTGAGIYFNAGDMQKTIAHCAKVSSEEGVLRLLAASHALCGEIERARVYGAKLKENYPGQTAAEMVGISPDRDPRVSQMFLQGLNLAGVK
jgi:DNA-binding SARP family transcriptional activator